MKPQPPPLKLPDRVDYDIPIISGIDELKRFMEGSIYRDFINEIDIRIMQLNELLEDDELIYTGRHYDLFRGGIKNMRQMKDIFNSLALAKEDQLNIDRKD